MKKMNNWEILSFFEKQEKDEEKRRMDQALPEIFWDYDEYYHCRHFGPFLEIDEIPFEDPRKKKGRLKQERDNSWKKRAIAIFYKNWAWTYAYRNTDNSNLAKKIARRVGKIFQARHFGSRKTKWSKYGRDGQHNLRRRETKNPRRKCIKDRLTMPEKEALELYRDGIKEITTIVTTEKPLRMVWDEVHNSKFHWSKDGKFLKIV